MGKISLDKLSEGMIIDEAVSDLHGTMLLQKGTAVTQSGIKILKTWGITEVSVDEASTKQCEGTTEPQTPPRFIEEATAEAAVLFRYVNEANAFSKELKRIAISRIAGAKSKEGSPC
ncbi:MAG TPA: hypothetical protein VMF88_08870 [Bacteroidota bacterium]|nr:hypothetical protein [Bacteroidota bacterium]